MASPVPPFVAAKPVVATPPFVDFDKKPHETFEAMHAANMANKAKKVAGR